MAYRLTSRPGEDIRSTLCFHKTLRGVDAFFWVSQLRLNFFGDFMNRSNSGVNRVHF